MLIVNADDLGRSRLETDAALACYTHGRINSASIMVFMADSERAANLAREAGMPVGLHLNLSEHFTAADVPPALLRSHARVSRFLNANKYTLVLYNPFLAADFAELVEAQCAEYERLFGRSPAHIDGHQHMHLSANVLVQRLLPEGARVRRNFSFAAGQKGVLNRWYRARVDDALARRHRLTDHFFSLSHHLTAKRMEGVAALARHSEVELMVHPAWRREFDFLMGGDFAQAQRAVVISSVRSA